MSVINHTPTAIPSVAPSNTVEVGIDTDLKYKGVDANGVVSIFNNDGLHDLNILYNGAMTIQQRTAVSSLTINNLSQIFNLIIYCNWMHNIYCTFDFE